MKLKMKNTTYDVLKYISLVLLDALGVAYESLADVWNLPNGAKVMKTCTIFSILIGALIGISNHNYKKEQTNDSNI